MSDSRHVQGEAAYVGYSKSPHPLEEQQQRLMQQVRLQLDLPGLQTQLAWLALFL